MLRDDFTPSSDVDVLVEFDNQVTSGLAFFSMEAELSALLGRKVELDAPGFLSRYFGIECSPRAEAGMSQASDAVRLRGACWTPVERPWRCWLEGRELSSRATRVAQLALARLLEIVGEAAGRVSSQYKAY